MTEFDFDELDKAVNELMSGVDTTKRNTALDEPEEKVVSLSAADQTATQPTAPMPTTAPVPQTSANDNATTNEPASAAASPLAVKRRGQFMDVMHPSSDMRSPQRVNRQAATIQPMNETVDPAESQDAVPSVPPEQSNATDEKASTTDMAPAVDVIAPLSFDMESTGSRQSTETNQQTSDTSPVSRQSEYPDPIDLAAKHDEISQASMATLTASTADHMADDEATQSIDLAPLAESSEGEQADRNAEPEQLAEEPPVELTNTPDETVPLTTPFLPDAKVEKRPLGGITPESNSLEPSQTPAAPSSSDTDKNMPTDPLTDAPLPEELQGDLVALESAPATTEATTELAAEPDSSRDAREATPAMNRPTSVAPIGGSITQQYTEAASTSDQTNGAIYDTQTYHQPVDDAKPAKKASPLKWIVWALVILIVGALAGAAYFFFTR